MSAIGLVYRHAIRNQNVGGGFMDLLPSALFEVPSIADVLRVASTVLATVAVSAAALLFAWARAESHTPDWTSEVRSVGTQVGRR